MYIFYDLETTGTDVTYDQILQFGAILTDEKLVELDRFEIRCRLLPWIVPSPGALLVTATDIKRLEDPSLPSFYSMMKHIAERLNEWGPAIFVGFNSIRFDEPFLQRAFWQALLPPYLTVTGGNARLDILPLFRAAAWFKPTLFNTPRREDGVPTFRLDALAPANGFNAHNAHDAMGDVEATLFLAQKVAAHFPELWNALVSRSSKASSAALLESSAPVFMFHHGGTPPVACYYRIDKGGGRQAHALLAPLGYDWAGTVGTPTERAMVIRSLVRRIALNKAPLIFSLTEAYEIAGLVPSNAELEQADFLAGSPDYCSHICELIEPLERTVPPIDAQVEETIFNGFANLSDQNLMKDYHQATPQEQLDIARRFSDTRFRRLAMRFLFVCAPHVMSPRELEQIKLGIAQRLTGGIKSQHAWRSVADALDEFASNPELAKIAEAQGITAWLNERRSQFNCRGA
ncbi:putative Exodeoxyribonuclease I [Agrobacterium tumefaciens str. Kerr 14]|uniref:Putative Exodeoxyribonuclease I n=2 Tax=Agrobacterium tumefaciens TaxID=358 RepID=A0A1S7S1J6_AGRTU|nr:hypothetical protein At12D1_39000 [Agrobacterium tumefaciens]CUX61209.1 putative Exodeoxyribonuclease I [Agrobacterium tumefaciens str. Kerr 14]